MSKPKGLGRGLDALLGGDDTGSRNDSMASVPVGAIRPGKYQPRTRMDQQALAELAASIRAQGLMQPLLVRPVGSSHGRDQYELIAGERRWRAAQLAGLDEVPVWCATCGQRGTCDGAHREYPARGLNPIEEATACKRLIDEFRMTHEQAADAVGRSRSATTNLLRLLKLAKPVQSMLMQGTLDMGHARALLALEGARQIEAANRIVARGMSARERSVGGAPGARPATRRTRKTDRDLARLEEEVSQRLGTTVQIRPGRKGSGTIVVSYSGLDHLDQLLKKLR